MALFFPLFGKVQLSGLQCAGARPGNAGKSENAQVVNSGNYLYKNPESLDQDGNTRTPTVPEGRQHPSQRENVGRLHGKTMWRNYGGSGISNIWVGRAGTIIY